MTIRPMRSVLATGAALVAAMVVAACGGDSGTGASSTAAASSAAAATTAAATTAADPALASAVKVYGEFTGGTAGAADPSQTPVTIGFVNDEGGIPSFPEGSVAADAAVAFINEQLGGVAGHPIALVKCLVAGQEEQGQGCAQQFLGDSSIKAVVEDSQVVGAGAFHKTLAGKLPTIIGSPNSIADATAGNAYAISAGVFGTDPGFTIYATQFLKAKTAALVFPGDDPTGQAAAKQIKDDMTKAGITVTDAGYKSSSPDFLPTLIAAGAGKADVTVTLFPSPPTCIAGAKALKQIGGDKPVLSLSLCIAEPVKQAVGDYPAWTYVAVNTNTEIPGDEATDAYTAVMKAYAPADANTGGFAQHAFMGVMTAAKAIAAAGGDTATPDAIGTWLKGFTGPLPMLPPEVHFGAIPPLPSLGSLASRLYTYEGNGSWKDATNGEWVQPPAG